MNEADVIKAMEIHANRGECCDCPYKGLPVGFCQKQLYVDALDLDKRQKAKIKALQMDNEQLQSDIANANMNLYHAQSEIESLQDTNEHLAVFLQEAKADAIKEFAERLKKDFKKPFYCNSKYVVVHIDNLVKEMTEGE